MKIAYRDVNNFVKNPPAEMAAVLVYGPDYGLMKERADDLGKSVVEDLGDPFNVVTLNPEILGEDPARLNDEAQAISMMGGRRLIRIEDGKDSLSVALKEYLKEPNSNALIVVQAGELSPRSSLRQLFEKGKNAAAVACYVEEEKDLAGLIRSSMQEASLRIDQDAVMWLAAQITGDRQKARREIEKLVTYMGEENHVTLADVEACCGQASAQTLDKLVYSVASGQRQDSMAAYHILKAEGLPAVTLIRTLQTHFRKLHLTKKRLQNGYNEQQAMKSLTPPIFFKLEASFKHQLSKWSDRDCTTILSRLSQLEAHCKTTRYPDDVLCAQALLAISAKS